MSRIVRIDNGKHTVSILNDEGETMEFTIPEEHRIDNNSKLAYLEHMKKQHNAPKTIKQKIKKQLKHPMLAPVIWSMVIQVVIIGIYAFIRFK